MFAIGPFHAAAHKVDCQEKFGARVTAGAGLAFGDNIEHVWAELRPYAHIMVRMSHAARLDFLAVLVSYLLQCSSRHCRFTTCLMSLKD